MKKIWDLYHKYEEIVNYLIVGGLTTLISLAVKYGLLFTNRNRPITYSIRLSEEERQLIDDKVKTSGLSRTDFLIRALTDKPVVVFERSGEILQELKRQGNNLNQAVRNCYFYPDEKEQVLSAAAECKRAYRALLSVIGGN